MYMVETWRITAVLAFMLFIIVEMVQAWMKNAEYERQNELLLKVLKRMDDELRKERAKNESRI